MKLSQLARIALLAATTFLAGGTSAFAADALQMNLQQFKVVKANDGKISYVPVTTADAGTVIQYKATYSNVTNTPINDITITVPVPVGMSFTGEAYPASAQATTDGTNYADMPLMRRVNGKLVKVPYSEYKSLRWNIKLLPAKKSADVSLNATVN
ncbi:hypothetical protein [Psychrobacter sp. I-STPA6b]|uniref:hypothetical protein n=1 Tax=Psychrobacter sp. I-STPA6b TaxID=2585718 RepID=UPI001D0C2D0E|nr:hypothetical protein [Psychrobacter sp. I-STPA6b]